MFALPRFFPYDEGERLGFPRIPNHPEIPMRSRLFPVLFLALVALPSLQAQNFVVNLTPEEDGGGARTGSGSVEISLSGSELTLTGSFTGLSGNSNNAHIHGPSGSFPASAGVLYDLSSIATLGGTDGTFNGTVTLVEGTQGFSIAQQLDQLMTGMWYINVHSTTFAGGEIRGQVLAAPLLVNYWALDETTGTVAPNSVAGGMDGVLNGNALWVTDLTRGQVLSFDGSAGTYVNATTIGPIGPGDDFTWAFWTNQDAAQTPPNNDVIVGNRQPNSGWSKFTPNAFEFRDITPTFNSVIDYPDIPLTTWVHHALVKRGQVMTYFRNGLALGNAAAPGTLAAGTPFYFGGDAGAGENWQGLLDDVATWETAVPVESIGAIATEVVKPDAAPLVVNDPVLVEVFSDDFEMDLGNWNITNRGLENTGIVGYDPASNAGGQAALGGMTDASFWFGRSLESAIAFDSLQHSEVSVDRVALTGTGSGFRSSVWIFGDAAHYFHFAQDIGELGWQYNARDDGGTGALLPTGTGNNLATLDALDADGGNHAISLRLRPGSLAGQLNIEMFVDGQFVGAHGLSNFPSTFQVILTGQARAAGDSVSAVFDNVSVRQEMATNFPPRFFAPTIALPLATDGAPYSQELVPFANDPEDDGLTFTMLSGSPWLSLSPSGTLSGTPGPGDVGLASAMVRVEDGIGGMAQSTFSFRVEATVPDPEVIYGWWPLNEGSGDVAADISGGGAEDGMIVNADTGGLGTNGSAWFEDPECGMVLSFNGENATVVDPLVPGAYVRIGDPPTTGLLPVIGLNDDFSLSAWVKSDQAPNTEIVIGNRYDPSGVDYAPRQFVKLTSSNFEWHRNGGGENIDFVDMPRDIWVHHAVVKDGPALFYYRNGVLTDARAITDAPNEMLPLYFAGQGVENWRGYLSDIRVYASTLSTQSVADLAASKGTLPQDFRITSIEIDAMDRVTLEWTAQPGLVYYVFASTDLVNWFEQIDAISETTYTVQPGGFPDTATAPAVYFRIEGRQP